ncbi:MAG: endo alpha-1,4 polygalactosaminidase [Planctomycetota bacterium]
MRAETCVAWRGLAFALLLVSCRGHDGDGTDADSAREPLPLTQVQYWAYQIQDLTEPGAVAALRDSRYDLLVIEPTRTDVSSRGSREFDTRAAVEELKRSAAHDGRHRKLVVAYIDIGEAENWRWYWTWSDEWPEGEPPPDDWPDFILARDPDGWEGNFPVAFWRDEWKDIVIYGENHPPDAARDFSSVLDEVVRDGFDGVYLDWVEAFSDEDVAGAASEEGLDAAEEMIEFIGEIRDYGLAHTTLSGDGFVVIQQNAADLLEGHPELLDVIDGLAQEDVWYLGEADAEWDDPAGHDIPQDPLYTSELLELLDLYLQAEIPVFTADYAVQHAGEVYATSSSLGFIPYCTRVALSRLTTTPPPGL